jgi:vancomycin permeability regulator SanA
MRKHLKDNWKLVLILSFSLVFVTFISSYMVIQKETSRIYDLDNPELANVASGIRVGIVLGGGVGLDRPSTIVQDRLDTAIELIDKNYIDVLLLSGDNSFVDYNEPQVMFDYLIQQGVPSEKLQRDFAGRSTYATCERANKIFGVKSAILISQDTHLPRAIYLCRHFGTDAYGVIAESETLKRTWVYQRGREFLARGKAVFNAYIIGEDTILGEKIDLKF